MIQTLIDVRLPDCDAMGIVHHAVYPIWYELGRLDFFEKHGFGYVRSRELGIDPAMVSLEMNYGLPVRFPQTLYLNTRCTMLEGKKIAFRYELFDGVNEKPVANAKSFHIWVRDTKSVNLQLEQPEMFSAYLRGLEPLD